MKPAIKFSFLLAWIILASVAVKAQNSLQLTAGYNVNIPSGTFHDFISRNAYTGFHAGLVYPFDNQFSLGLEFSYNDFYQKYPRAVYDVDKSTTISAVVSNSVQLAPLIVKANYILTGSGWIRPYISAGGGVNIVTYAQYLGEFGGTQSYLKPTVMGDAGIYIPFKPYSPSVALIVGGGYNYTPFHENGVSDMNTWGIHAGLSIPLH